MVRIDFSKEEHGKVISHLKISIIYLIKLKNLTKIVLFFIFWTNFVKTVDFFNTKNNRMAMLDLRKK